MVDTSVHKKYKISTKWWSMLTKMSHYWSRHVSENQWAWCLQRNAAETISMWSVSWLKLHSWSMHSLDLVLILEREGSGRKKM